MWVEYQNSPESRFKTWFDVMGLLGLHVILGMLFGNIIPLLVTCVTVIRYRPHDISFLRNKDYHEFNLPFEISLNFSTRDSFGSSCKNHRIFLDALSEFWTSPFASFEKDESIIRRRPKNQKKIKQSKNLLLWHMLTNLVKFWPLVVEMLCENAWPDCVRFHMLTFFYNARGITTSKIGSSRSPTRLRGLSVSFVFPFSLRFRSCTPSSFRGNGYESKYIIHRM